MPVIKKQEPRPALRKPSANGSGGDILAEAIPVGELQSDFIKFCLYGANRVGKTHLACQFPKPLLLVCFEPTKSGGAKTVKKVPGVTALKIGLKGCLDFSGREQDEQGITKAGRLAVRLKEECPYKTVVIDSATSFQDIILAEMLNLEKVPEQLDWGEVSQDQYRKRSEKSKEALRPFLDLECHTVVVVKEKDHNPPKDERNVLTRGLQMESILGPDLGAATAKWLNDACDYIARLYVDKEVRVEWRDPIIKGQTEKRRVEVDTGRQVRRLRTMLHTNFMAGFRSEFFDAVPEWITEPTFAKIEKVIRGTKLTEAEGGHYP